MLLSEVVLPKIGCIFFQSFFYAFTHGTSKVEFKFCFFFFLQMRSYYRFFGSRVFLPSFISFLPPLLSFPLSPPSFPLSLLPSSLSPFLSLLTKWMFIRNYLPLLRAYKLLNLHSNNCHLCRKHPFAAGQLCSLLRIN